MKKELVGIFTKRSTQPLHPRLKTYMQFFNDHDVSCAIYNNQKSSRILNLLSWVFLGYFDLSGIYYQRKKISQHNIVIINDLKLLPLAIFARFKKKSVIYETLDNNVHLRFDYLKKHKSRLFIPFKYIIIPTFSLLEKLVAYTFCHKIIVNSPALKKYFNEKAQILYYSSPYEKSQFQNNPSKNVVFIYLGHNSKDKGFFEMVGMSEKQNRKLYIFGNSDELSSIQIKNNNNENVISYPKMDTSILINKLKALSDNYFLCGFSLIKSVHYSYKTQEANKDIEYLSLGIPIIGNDRAPTLEKIRHGCGVLYYDQKQVDELLSNSNLREEISEKCKTYYRSNYRYSLFVDRLKNIFVQLGYNLQ